MMYLQLKSLLATTASISLVLAQAISNDATNFEPRGLRQMLPWGQNNGLATCHQNCQSQFEKCLKMIPPTADCETPLNVCITACINKYPKGKLSDGF
jgi:hypothetical protein